MAAVAAASWRPTPRISSALSAASGSDVGETIGDRRVAPYLKRGTMVSILRLAIRVPAGASLAGAEGSYPASLSGNTLVARTE